MSKVDFTSLAIPPIRSLENYQPGKAIDQLKRELGINNIIKLASNENPLGPSPKAVQAMQNALSHSHLYPDNDCHQLKQALSKKHSVDTSQITLGCGSNVILDMIVRGFCDEGSEVIYTEHAFNVIPIATAAVGARAIVIEEQGFCHDLVATAQAVTPATKLIYLANPNNPTGTFNTKEQVKTLLASIPPEVLVVIDQAYDEYIDHPHYPRAIEWLAPYPNLILTRTFSKIFALADLRIGYALSHPTIADLLHRLRMPFNNSRIACQGAITSLADHEFIKQSKQTNDQGVTQLKEGLSSLGLNYIRNTLGNFLTVDFQKNALPLYQKLLEKGIIVRPLIPYAMPHYLRISVGTEQDNRRLLSTLAGL